MDSKQVRKDFPMYQSNKGLVYLDSAASSLTPQVVIDAMDTYYKEYRSNVHRGLYPASATATERYEQARKTIAEFIGATEKEIIFTSGVTAGFNMLARSLGAALTEGDNVVLTQLEHHANIVPWQEAAKRQGFELRYIEIDATGKIQQESIASMIDEHTKVVSCAMISNALGTMLPYAEIIQAAKKVDAITVLDAAQAIAHQPIDVQTVGCDYLLASGHKMYGPTGIGFVFGRVEQLSTLEPAVYGGDMIELVTFETATWAEIPHRFEAGTPNIAGAIGLATAAVYLQHLRWDAIQKHEDDLKKYLLAQVRDSAKIIGPELAAERAGVVSFEIPGVHPHDVADILGRSAICVRAGHHCAMPLMKQLGVNGTVRASLGVYNTREDVDALITGIAQVKAVFETT